MSSLKEEEDEEITLPSDTLAALQDFYSERDARAKHFEDLKTKAEKDFEGQVVSIDDFTEDWNASQFWYSDETARTLASALLNGATHDTWIAVVSAPSVFVQLKKILGTIDATERPRLHLLEFDERFAVFKEFEKYDFASPFRLPPAFKQRFDRIIVDPPFLSEDCQTKVAMTVRWMSNPTTQVQLIACTGAVMEPLMHKLYAKQNIRTTTFLPQHSKGLSNEFRCYANITTEDLG